ncbi:MAG: glycosyltransferase [Proteobacteria bacterium]|nr:glycosyltransferase [Pseudomonadota bacterium]MBU1711278.1 glycosyltransferase [Pseudomonadota bacterium]
MHVHNDRIAVLIPCYNEAATIATVVNDFAAALPDAQIFVFDNNSTDSSADIARKAGATVISEYRQGKGNVIRSMFRSLEADIYVLVDGDSTYPADQVHNLIEPIIAKRANMTVGDRISTTYDLINHRRFHSFGNRLIRWLVNRLFASNLNDIMSGYRAFDRLFVKNFPVMSDEFEIETEMTIHALEKKFNIQEIPINYKDRPKGSTSKLNTFSDGFKIIKTIAFIFKNHKPMIFFGGTAILLALLGVVIGAFPVYEYMTYSYVFKVPSAILAAALETMALLSLTSGVILDTIVRQHKETYELHLSSYLSRTDINR